MFVESINDTGPRLRRWANELMRTMASHSGGHSNKYKPSALGAQRKQRSIVTVGQGGGGL